MDYEIIVDLNYPTFEVPIRRWRRLILRCRLLLRQAALRAVSLLWHVASSRVLQEECLHNEEYLRRTSNMWAEQMICERQRGGCGAVLTNIPTAEAIRS